MDDMVDEMLLADFLRAAVAIGEDAAAQDVQLVPPQDPAQVAVGQRRRRRQQPAADQRPRQRRRFAPGAAAGAEVDGRGDAPDQGGDRLDPFQYDQPEPFQYDQQSDEEQQGARFIPHQERRRRLAQARARARPGLAMAYLDSQAIPQQQACDVCGDRPAVVACRTCSEFQPILCCGACDQARHPHAHTHSRQIWSQGFWQHIRADEAIDDATLQHILGEHQAVTLLSASCSCLHEEYLC